MEETLSLKELLATLKKRFKLITIITVSAVIVSGLLSFYFLTPIYQSSTQILVNQAKNDQSIYSPSEVQTNLQLINTYNVIIKSPAILDKVAKQLKRGLTAQKLNEQITVGSEKESQVVNVSVQDPDPVLAAKIANKTAEVFQTEIVKIMNVDNVSILAKASVMEHQSPIKPKPIINMGIALVVGLMAGVGLAFLLEYFDTTIKNEQEIEKLLGLPVLGVIANIEDTKMSVKRFKSEPTTTVRGESVGS